jgi:predicted ATPase
MGLEEEAGAEDGSADVQSWQLSRTPTNLPASLTSFVGREKVIEAIRSMLWKVDVRLLTLTGPGGTGKTRLALQVAGAMLDDFQDGAFFVELAALNDPALVPSTIAQTLGLPETVGRHPVLDSLKEYLRDKRLLLVLDNFEQLLGAALVVDALVRAAPNLKVLVTSRAPLHLSGERDFPVPPLALPDGQEILSLRRMDDHSVLSPPERSDASVLATVESVRLFVERAQAVRPDFAVTEENAAAVAEICVRLDGLPLAIELAAARVKFLSPQALLARLDSRLKLLTGGPTDLPARHQTLRDTIAWSYDLLTPGEQQFFRRMAVFQGGRTIEALEAICSGAGMQISVLAGIESLVDKSLLQVREGEDGEARYWMLETIHEYAREKLAESGEGEALAERHAAYFVALAEEAPPKLRGKEQLLWLGRLEDEQDNLRAAFDWAAQRGDAELALRLASSLGIFWQIRSYLSEGRERLSTALSLPGPPALRSRALRVAGDLATLQEDYAAASSFVEESLALAEKAGTKEDVAAALYTLGRLATYDGDLVIAQASLARCLDLCREMGDEWGSALALNGLGYLANRRGDWQEHHAYVEEAAHLLRKRGDSWATARALNNLGVSLRIHHADYDKARLIAEETLALCRALKDKMGIGLSFANIGLSAINQGDFPVARAFMERALAVFHDINFKQKIGETLSNLSEIVRSQGDYAQAQKIAGESVAIFEELGSKVGIAFSVDVLALSVACHGDYSRALALLERSVSLFEEVGSLDVIGPGLESVATVTRWQGDFKRAAAVLDKALAWRRAHESGGNKVIAANLLCERGMVAWAQGFYEEAQSSLRESLSLSYKYRCRYSMAYSLTALAGLAASEGSDVEALPRAARLAGAATTLLRITGGRFPPHDQMLFDDALARAREWLGEAAWESAYREGNTLPLEQTVSPLIVSYRERRSEGALAPDPV